ncbi:MAG TPA: pantetheine-phosphate adenylyltransferase [Planctomycetota bacterium]|nr:pantetheine-phosphate adenylyltransferase [Planctomycetota bacterium]
MKRAIYPGTFDPITFGHTDVIERGAKVFDELIVAVAANPAKKPLFSLEERKQIIRELTAHMPNVHVDSFTGMTVDYVRSVGTNIILRGMRTMSDFENEFQMALSNRAFAGGHVETVFLMTSAEHSFISSHRIKEVAALGADISAFVPPIVVAMLKDKMNK